MNKVKKVLMLGLLLVVLGVNAINISPLGEPPGWNGTEPKSVTVLDEEV